MNEQYNMNLSNEPEAEEQPPTLPQYGNLEADITNIVGQIDPQTIIDNLDHALKGEQWNKEISEWVMNVSKEPLVNDNCRGAVISYLDGILNNNTTMGNIDEKRLGHLMESVIETITKIFVVNLEKFGFVPKGAKYDDGVYENKGTPDTATMTLVSNMVYTVCFLVFSRALKGQESIRIFKSLNLNDQMNYGGMPQQPKQGWVGKLFNRGG